MGDLEPSGELGLGRAHKPYLGAELTFLLWVKAGTGRERGSWGSPARLGAPWVPIRQCAAVPRWRGGHGAVLPRSSPCAPTPVGGPGREAASRLAGSGLRGTEVAQLAPRHAPTLRSLSFVLRLRKEVRGRKLKTPRGSGWRSVFVTRGVASKSLKQKIR